MPSRHLEIWAREEEVAERASRLVYCGALLSIPDLIHDHNPPGPWAAASLPRRHLTQKPWRDLFQNYNCLAVGCAAAAAALETPQLIYALEKHHLSLSLDWFTTKSAAPIYGQKFPTHYPDEFTYHVRAAFALVAAFSVVEELGLEIRSSAKRPRFLPGTDQEWNPEVRLDVSNRLQALGLSAEEDFHWIVRGEVTELRMKLALSEKALSRPSGRSDVSDRRLELIDAIHLASWLRNKVSAHRFADLTSQLGPYEVHNCQRLARHLLGASLNLFPLVERWRKAS
jgi:hypothetical protein